MNDPTPETNRLGRGMVYALIAMLAIFVIFAGMLFYQTRRSTASNQQLEYSNQAHTAEITHIKRQSAALSPDKVITKIKQSNVNVQTSLDAAATHIGQSIDLVYNKTSNKAAYDQLSSKLPKLVGKDLSDKLISLDEPVVSQAGKPEFPYGKATQTLITFGQYDYQSTSVPIYVAVSYDTPPIQVSGTSKKEISTRKGQDLFILDYDIKSNQIGLTDYLKGDGQNG